MSEDKTPQRPDGLNQDASSHIPAPRVAVEPTPVPPADAAPTTQMPASGAHAATGADATQARPQTPPDFSAASTAPAPRRSPVPS